MKKIFLLVAFFISISLNSYSQTISPNALGLKFGTGTGEIDGFDFQFSYQRGMSLDNRLELNLGFNSGRSEDPNFLLGGYYQWVWHLEGSFNWYVGPGAQLGFINMHEFSSTDFLFGLGGQIGLEYCFSQTPIHITLDYNPTIGLTNSIGYYGPISIGVRYLF